MTKLHTEVGPITSYHLSTPETKFPSGRVIPAAFWISYFTLHWLTILGVVPHCVTTSGNTIYFLAAAVLSTILIATNEAIKEKKNE